MQNNKLNYSKFLELPLMERIDIENAAVKACKSYLDSGDSISVSINKTAKNPIFMTGVIEKILRNNQEMLAIFKNKRKKRVGWN